jgi:adenylylsulfate kinase
MSHPSVESQQTNEGGHVFWLLGLSGAGKTTLAEALRRDLLRHAGLKALMLDGDRLRAGLCRGLGFSEEGRSENLRRAAEVARLGLDSGLVVIAAFITPQESQRRSIESVIGAGRVSFIYAGASLSVCQRRDVKGLYARAAAGGLAGMTGISMDFEVPLRPSLQLDTGTESPEVSASRAWAFARSRLNI